MKDKILLHSCCAPCSSYSIIKLKDDGFIPIVFFYNPNIYPIKEYEIRKEELKKYCQKLDIEYIEGDYEENLFYKKIEGFEKEPEKGKRCEKCFELRLEKTFELADKLKIKYITTTLTISPHKNSNQIFEVAKKLQKKYKPKFLEYNFKKEDGFKKSRQVANENSMYFQKYCGCKYSIRS